MYRVRWANTLCVW